MDDQKTSRVATKWSKSTDAAVEGLYVVSELFAKAGKPFTKGQFLKDCILIAIGIPKNKEVPS